MSHLLTHDSLQIAIAWLSRLHLYLKKEDYESQYLAKKKYLSLPERKIRILAFGYQRWRDENEWFNESDVRHDAKLHSEDYTRLRELLEDFSKKDYFERAPKTGGTVIYYKITEKGRDLTNHMKEHLTDQMKEFFEYQGLDDELAGS